MNYFHIVVFITIGILALLMAINNILYARVVGRLLIASLGIACLVVLLLRYYFGLDHLSIELIGISIVAMGTLLQKYLTKQWFPKAEFTDNPGFANNPVSISHVVLNLDTEEPAFLDQCIYCGKPDPSNVITLRSWDKPFRASQYPANRVFRVPIHRGTCTINTRFGWTLKRYYLAISIFLSVATALLLMYFELTVNIVMAGWALALLICPLMVVHYQNKYLFTIYVWPDKCGALDYLFSFKDKETAKVFRGMNVARISRRQAIHQRK